MKITSERHNLLKGTVSALQFDRLPHWRLWRELADYYLPRRYTWLLSDRERSVRNAKNPYILDGTGTIAARTLASGMMNGITSPSRPWFKLRINGFDDETETPARLWLDEVTRRMMLVMAESNFYNALAVLYLDLVVFGSAAMLIYEDYESVIRSYNPPLGEFYFAQSDRLQVCTFAREFSYTIHQTAMKFGLENMSEQSQARYKEGGAALHQPITIMHLIEPNDDPIPGVPAKFKYREFYWEQASQVGTVLSIKGFHELPGIFPRWELSGNDSYGSSPAMDALGDVIQLQHETKKKAQSLDKLISPPIIADIQLQNRPTALLPNGVTYVAGVNNVGAKPIYQITPPLGEMTLDIKDVQGRIRETFHNDLFRMISQLETVRSASEIIERKEEKLVLLGSVLERFENEALDPAINRIFSIMMRAGLLPPAPEGLADVDMEIQYVSILSSAQRAVGAIPTERWIALVGNIAPIYPKAMNIPNWDELLRDYARDIGVPAKGINSKDATDQINAAQDQQLAAQAAANEGAVLVDSARQLSETDVGGGANALQQILGG